MKPPSRVSPPPARDVRCRLARWAGRCAVAAVCLVLASLSGCSQDTRPALGTAHGTVTLDGKPLAGASLVFEPVEPNRASTGRTDVDGQYELTYIRQDKGAKVGSHVVRISAPGPGSRGGELLPPRYNTQSVLKAEVREGDNVIDFPLSLK